MKHCWHDKTRTVYQGRREEAIDIVIRTSCCFCDKDKSVYGSLPIKGHGKYCPTRASDVLDRSDEECTERK